LSQRTVYKCSI